MNENQIQRVVNDYINSGWFKGGRKHLTTDFASWWDLNRSKYLDGSKFKPYTNVRLSNGELWCVEQYFEHNDTYLINNMGDEYQVVGSEELSLWYPVDGDVVKIYGAIGIFHSIDEEEAVKLHCAITMEGDLEVYDKPAYGWGYLKDVEPASVGEREYLQEKLEKGGYQWDFRENKVVKPASTQVYYKAGQEVSISYDNGSHYIMILKEDFKDGDTELVPLVTVSKTEELFTEGTMWVKGCTYLGLSDSEDRELLDSVLRRERLIHNTVTNNLNVLPRVCK